MPDVLADQVVAHGRHEVPPVEVAEPVQQLGHPQPHGGLADTGGASEAHVQIRPGRQEAQPLAHLGDQEKCRHLLYSALYRPKTDQLTIEGSEDVVDAGRLTLGGKVDLGLWRELLGPQLGPAVLPRGPPRRVLAHGQYRGLCGRSAGQG
jgi:hypothetical protein